MSASPAFELREVSAGPPDAPIFRDVSIVAPASGVTVVAGPSGAGKSTLLRLLNRLDEPIAGEIRWEDRPLTSLDPIRLRREIGMVFQRPPLFPGTVMDNLRVADGTLDAERAGAALERADLSADKLMADASTLSGGEAQRMCLARCLLTDPAVVLADEPTASLDQDSRRSVERLARVLAEDGVGVIWVTHDTDQLRRLADHVLVLAAGGRATVGHLPDLDAHHDADVRRIVGAS